MSEPTSVRGTTQEAFEHIAMAQSLLMASLVKALASAGAVRIDTVHALLEHDQLIHPLAPVQAMAQKMQRALLLSLTLSERPAGEG